MITKLKLKPVGRDDFSRQVYKTEEGFYLKDIEDVNSGEPKFTGKENLHTADSFRGEPDSPIKQTIEITFEGDDNDEDEEEREHEEPPAGSEDAYRGDSWGERDSDKAHHRY